MLLWNLIKGEKSNIYYSLSQFWLHIFFFLLTSLLFLREQFACFESPVRHTSVMLFYVIRSEKEKRVMLSGLTSQGFIWKKKWSEEFSLARSDNHVFIIWLYILFYVFILLLLLLLSQFLTTPSHQPVSSRVTMKIENLTIEASFHNSNNKLLAVRENTPFLKWA